MSNSSGFIALRDQLLRLREDLPRAQRDFRWPSFDGFNWAGDYFDVIAADNSATALRLVDDAGTDVAVSFSALARRGAQVAAFLASHGLQRGDRLLLMLPNSIALWETMLAAIRMGAVIIPASTLLDRADLTDRLERGAVSAVITDAALTERFRGVAGAPLRIAVGAVAEGWRSYAESMQADEDFPVAATRADEPKAFVALAPGAVPDAATAASIFAHVRERVSPYKRIRRLEFAALPKTISGKIRRVELRRLEQTRASGNIRRPQEFWEEDLRTAGAPQR